MRLFRHTQPDETVPPGTCMYRDHLIPAGEPFISIDYSQERCADGVNVDVDESGSMLFACMAHAPSQDEVIKALQSAGIPV